MLPDLKKAKNFYSSRSKTTDILNKVLATKLKGDLCDFIEVLPYEGQLLTMVPMITL